MFDVDKRKKKQKGIVRSAGIPDINKSYWCYNYIKHYQNSLKVLLCGIVGALHL